MFTTFTCLLNFAEIFTIIQKKKLHGLTRKSGRGLPASIMQEELHNRKEQQKVQGTVLSADLVGNSKCPSLIAMSVYNISCNDSTSYFFLLLSVM